MYRKYRPQQFKDVVGQNHIKIILENEITSGRLAHAYLFSGPRGTGKTTTARIFAKTMNCLNRKSGEAEACGKCDACKEIDAGRAIDIIEMDAASHTGVDNVRENVIENVRFAPTRLKYKVFIIDEAHMLSTAAFNAFLKTLEEPPSYVVYILATTEIHKMPQTIVSRCERFDFKKILPDVIIERLKKITTKENFKVSKEVLQSIAEHSEGCLRDAEGLLGQVLTLSDGKNEITFDEASLILPHSDSGLILELSTYLLNRDARNAMEFVGRSVGEGIEVGEFFNGLIKFFRDLIWYKMSGEINSLPFIGDAEKQKELINSLENTDANRLLQIIEILFEKKKLIGQAQIAELPLELASIKICS